ncbi:hypothetical protein NQ314_003685 [Rhamnusium bicolor]|uniref:Uncharacterized protein n=1 Tax=Rhamnusium bicolor TaxID=1586634 RepID=A0AAV8ZPK2_9CUCU|nr:hypothetical protein NQ314_003685 [Rhamnusium bicolor]
MYNQIVLVIGVSGPCRTNELVKMKMSGVAMLKKISVEILDSKIYTSRTFFITNLLGENFSKLHKSSKSHKNQQIVSSGQRRKGKKLTSRSQFNSQFSEK